MNAKTGIALVTSISVIHYSIMGYAGYDPSIETETLLGISLIFMFAWWAFEDAAKFKFHRPYEFGAFVLFAWPIVLPAYLVATRGWRGIFIFPLFLFLNYLPWATGWLAYYANKSNN